MAPEDQPEDDHDHSADEEDDEQDEHDFGGHAGETDDPSRDVDGGHPPSGSPAVKGGGGESSVKLLVDSNPRKTWRACECPLKTLVSPLGGRSYLADWAGGTRLPHRRPLSETQGKAFACLHRSVWAEGTDVCPVSSNDATDSRCPTNAAPFASTRASPALMLRTARRERRRKGSSLSSPHRSS